MKSSARLLGPVVVNFAALACAVRTGLAQMSFCNGVGYVKPAFAAGRAGLAFSCVDRWHLPTLVCASSYVGDFYVIRMAYDSNVIYLLDGECAPHVPVTSA